MTRTWVFALFFTAVFLQAGAYGLTFMLPKLFETFQANEKDVGRMLMITTCATLAAVYFAGHLSDKFGRVLTLALACLAIAAALFLYGWSSSVGLTLILASVLLGCGWGLTYALAPVVLTRLVGPEDRVRYFALLSIFVMAGFGLAPVLAAQLLKYGFHVADAFYLTAGLCVISAGLFFWLIVSIQRITDTTGAEAQSRLTLLSIQHIIKSRALVPVVMVFLGASVFAGMNNFQTVFAEEKGLEYSVYFLTYTITVVVFRILLARFKGGTSPYLTIAVLQYIMAASVGLFMVIGFNPGLYILVAILFGLGYGASYPILAAMAANDADSHLVPQTLQLFALTYFIGIFGFPLLAGWVIVEIGSAILLSLVVLLALIEATLALKRGLTSDSMS